MIIKIVAKTDIPFPLQCIMRGPLSESDCSSLIYLCEALASYSTVLLPAACPEPDTFPNGKYTSSGYPETVQYSCHSGYTLSGPEKQQCTNGKWDPPQQPVCKGKYGGCTSFCGSSINRGSYMSAHVLLNLLNKLGKRDKMQGLPRILSLSQRV